MKKCFSVIDKLSQFAGIVSGVLVVFMTAFLTISVLTRWLFRYSINGAYEITQFALAVTFIASYSYAQTCRRHVCLSILIKNFPDKVKYALSTFTNLFGMVIVCILFYAFCVHGKYCIDTKFESTNLHLPIGPLCFACAAMLAIFALTLLEDVIKSILAFRGNEEYREDLSRSWV